MTSIFVAKLDFAVDNQQLQSLFEEYGKVNKVTVALDRETGKSRGFGFVEMFDDAEAQSAIEALDGHEVNGRSLAVKEAEDRGGSKPAPRRDAPRPVNRDSSSGSSSETPPYNPSATSDDAPSKDFSRKKTNKPKTRSFDTPDEGRGKQTKLNPYKKSGKNSIHIEDDDDFEDIDLFGRNDDEDDEDYSKYLVNADDSDDDDYDDEYDDDEEYDDED